MMNAAKDMMPLKRVRDEYGCAFLIAAHTKKGADTGREGLWGSQFLNAFLETGWQIRDREGDREDNQVQLHRHFKSAGNPEKLNLEFMLDDDQGYRVEVTDAEDEDGKHDVVLAELTKHPEGAKTSLLAERCGMPERTIRRRLGTFRKKGLVVLDRGRSKAGGVDTIWKLPKDTTANLAPKETEDGE